MQKAIQPRTLILILALLVEAGALNAAIIYRAPFYFLIIPVILTSLFAVVLTRKLRRLGVVFMISALAMITALPNSWLWGWWEQRQMRAAFAQESVTDLVFDQRVLDRMQEGERLKQLAMAFKSNLHTDQPIAQLEIPRIGLNVIVVEGTGDSALRKGPGHIEETPLPGMQDNFAVAGDRVLYGAPFLKLDQLEPGDNIMLKTPYGKFTYMVSNKTIISPDDINIIKPTGTEMITLATCDPPWDISRRLVIQGTMTEMSLV